MWPQGMTADDYCDPPEKVTCCNCFAIYGDDKTECPFCERTEPEGQTVIIVGKGNSVGGEVIIRILGIPIPAENILVDNRPAAAMSMRPVPTELVTKRYEAFQ